MTPDVNILLAASRKDHPHHVPALAWLEQAIADSETTHALAVLPMVAAGFLRLATHPRVFDPPAPLVDAQAFLDAILSAPGVSMVSLGGEWAYFTALCARLGLTGNAAANQEPVGLKKGIDLRIGQKLCDLRGRPGARDRKAARVQGGHLCRSHGRITGGGSAGGAASAPRK